MPLSRYMLLLPTVLFALIAEAAVAAPPAPRGRDRVVRGMDGQAHLKLDIGRSLRRYPLTRRQLRTRIDSNKPLKRSAAWLSRVEKMRLDARRIGRASRLSSQDKLERLVNIVERKLPSREGVLERYLQLSYRQQRSSGLARLSTYLDKRTGICRERAFTLRTLLHEAGVPARVVYSEVYDGQNTYRGDHAFVVARSGRRRLLLDPGAPTPIQPLKQITVQSEGPTGLVPTRAAVTNEGWLYLPTRDLSYLKR